MMGVAAYMYHDCMFLFVCVRDLSGIVAYFGDIVQVVRMNAWDGVVMTWTKVEQCRMNLTAVSTDIIAFYSNLCLSQILGIGHCFSLLVAPGNGSNMFY